MRRPSASREESARGCSSRSTTSGSPFRCGTEIGTIWSCEPAGFDGGDGPLLALEREGVLALARDAPALGDVLGGLAHRVRVVPLGQARVDEPPAERRVGHLAVAAVVGRLGLELDVRRPGHRFDTATDEHVAVADRDRMRRRVDRLEPRPAQPVDGQATDLDREVGEQERHPRDVAVVLAGLVRAAEDDVLDEGRVDAGTVHQPAQDRGGQVVRADAGQGAAVATDGGPDRLDDPGFTKGTIQIACHAPDGSGAVGSSPPEVAETRKGHAGARRRVAGRGR